MCRITCTPNIPKSALINPTPPQKYFCPPSPKSGGLLALARSICLLANSSCSWERAASIWRPDRSRCLRQDNNIRLYWIMKDLYLPPKGSSPCRAELSKCDEWTGDSSLSWEPPAVPPGASLFLFLLSKIFMFTACCWLSLYSSFVSRVDAPRCKTHVKIKS